MEREGKRARDNACLQVQAGNGQLPAAVSRRTVATHPITTAPGINVGGNGVRSVLKRERANPLNALRPEAE